MKLLALLFVLCVSGLLAQPTFVKVIYATGTIANDLNELSSGNLKVGISLGRGTSLLDPEGNLIQSQIYNVDTFLAMGSLKRYTDNEYYFVGGYYRDSCTVPEGNYNRQIHPVFGKMDSLGIISQASYYRLNTSDCASFAQGLSVNADGSAFVWGDSKYALKVNAQGVVQWARHFGRRVAFQFMKELPNGDVLAGLNTSVAGAAVARLGPNGDFIWCKSYFRPSGMIADCIVETDDSFVVVGYSDSLRGDFAPWPTGYDPKLFTMKLNGNGEVQWCKGYSTAQPWYTPDQPVVTKTQDGNYVMLADIGNPIYRIEGRPHMMKLDQNGDTLWTRAYGADGFRYETRNVLAYSDGGYIFNGYVYGALPDGQSGNAFLNKTDSLGHLPCNEYYEPLEVVDLFPVDSSFTLVSEDGAEVRQAFIEYADWPLMEPIDTCFITTSVYDVDGPAPKPRIRPNPNTGRFTMQFADPLLAESYYSVYDTMGKLLVQRRLPTGATVEEVDLAGYGAGTYVVKVTSPDGVCHERVVVE